MNRSRRLLGRQPALDPRSALTQESSAIALRRVVTDRQQLEQLDYWIARTSQRAQRPPERARIPRDPLPEAAERLGADLPRRRPATADERPRTLAPAPGRARAARRDPRGRPPGRPALAVRWYRLRWFFFSYVVESITHGVTVLVAFRGLAWDNFLLVLVATAATSLDLGVLVGRAGGIRAQRARPAPLRGPAPHPAASEAGSRLTLLISGGLLVASSAGRLDLVDGSFGPAEAYVAASVLRLARRPADPDLPLGRVRAASRLQAVAARRSAPEVLAARGDARPLAARRRLGAGLRRAAQHHVDDRVQPPLHEARLLLPRVRAASGGAVGHDARRTPRGRARDAGRWLRPCCDGARRARRPRAPLQGARPTRRRCSSSSSRCRRFGPGRIGRGFSTST